MTSSFHDMAKKLYPAAIAGLLTALVCAVSLVCYAGSNRHDRYLYIFEPDSYDGSAGTRLIETRYIERQADRDLAVRLYLEDLLLGPMTQRYVHLFAKGTSLVSCFSRGSVLYVDLSKDALYTDAQSMTVEAGVQLLKENIYRNFPPLTGVVVFIDGKAAFEQL